MSRRFHAVFWLALICCLLLSGCGKKENGQEAVLQSKDERIQIGITFDSFVIERWQRDRDVFVSAAQELGAGVNIQNANGDLKEQIAQIHYFVQKKVDVIVIVANNSDGLTEAVDKAHRAGIPVIAYDRLIKNANVDLYISFDSEQVGSLMAGHMKEHLSEGSSILQICGPLADNNVSCIMNGFTEGLEDYDIKVALIEYAEGWLAETGFTVTSSYIGAHPAPGGIMCGNDDIAGQAVRALSERRMAGDVCVVGQDADLAACQRIVEGTQCMTVYKPVEKLARRAAELAVQLAEGIDIYTTDRMDDGIWEIPYERLEPIAVTKENMDQVITGKYHEESDIYLNVKR